MKNILTILFLISAHFNISAQNKHQVEKSFVKELNTIINNSDEHHWGYEGKMSIDTPFSIDKNGILSVEIRYVTDSSTVRIRMEAPIYKAVSVLYDHYIILEYPKEDVTIINLDNETELPSKNNLFHIGAPRDLFRKQDKLQLLLEKVLKFYNK